MKGVALLYLGYREEVFTDENLAKLYQGEYQNNFSTNEYLLIRGKDNRIIDKRRFDGRSFVELKFHAIKSLKPKTWKQEFAFDLLSNKDIPVKILAGVPGSGKSYLALRHGFHYLNKKWVKKIVIIRHNVPIGEKDGYFKGTKEQKAMEWLGCVKDNLEVKDTQFNFEELLSKGIVELETVSTIKGRSIKDAWVVIEECEDLTPEQFKVIGERIGEGSYICYVGDYNQVSQNKYKENNGLKIAFDTLTGFPDIGFITFDNVLEDDIRSNVSKIFAYYYGEKREK